MFKSGMEIVKYNFHLVTDKDWRWWGGNTC